MPVELRSRLRIAYQQELDAKAAELYNRCGKLPAEKTKIADDLQKSLGKTKKENAELQRKVAELEAKVEELAPEDERRSMPKKNQLLREGTRDSAGGRRLMAILNRQPKPW